MPLCKGVTPIFDANITGSETAGSNDGRDRDSVSVMPRCTHSHISRFDIASVYAVTNDIACV
jgi:hypothetical protein